LGRRPRLEYEGAVYHVIQKGNNKENIFEDDIHKEIIINNVLNYVKPMKYSIYGYVIMSNHYHLIIQTTDIPLQKIMHRINNNYSKYYNRKMNRTGHVFGDRYKAIPVLDETYLLTLIRYVHQNPVRAKICRTVKEYGWNSDFFYRNNVKGNLNIDFVLNMLSEDREKAVTLYEGFMSTYEQENYDEKTTIGGALQNPVPEVCSPEREELDDILRQTEVNMEYFRLIKAGSRRRELTPYKTKYVQKAFKLNYTLKEIGDNVNISDAAVFRLINSKINENSISY